MPVYGEMTRVRPTAAHVVKDCSISGVLMTPEAFLPACGEELPWSAHLETRLSHGEIEIVASVSHVEE